MSVLDYINYDIFTPVYKNKLPFLRSKNVDKICRELYYAVKEREKIFVYGDYDMDGFSAAKVWDEVLSTLYNVPVTHFMYKSRQHSVDPNIVEQANESGARIVIICDSGSSSQDHETVSLLRLSGHTPIVIDHHNWEGDYIADSDYNLVFNSHEERDLLGGAEISGAYASLMICNVLCDKYFNHSLSYNAIVFALASMYSDVVDLATPPGRALYNQVSMIKMPGPALIESMNKWGYSNCRRLFSFIIGPKVNACFRTESFGPLNKALVANDKYEIKKVADEIAEVHSESSRLVDLLAPMFKYERFGTDLLLCTHEMTENSELMHVRNFSGLIANKIAHQEKCMVIAVIKMGSEYVGSYRDFYNRSMLETLKLFCYADGHDTAFGIRFSDINEVRRHLRIVVPTLEAGVRKDYTVMNSNMAKTEEDIQALALYNEYMNVRPRVMLTHHCPYIRTIRSTNFKKFYDVGMPYQVSSTMPLLEGTNILVEPTMSKSVELRCIE